MYKMNDELSFSNRSRVVTALLALFFGCFGAHKFYLGFVHEGRKRLLIFFSIPIMIIICKISAVFSADMEKSFLILFVVWIVILASINIIESVRIFRGFATDSDGRYLK